MLRYFFVISTDFFFIFFQLLVRIVPVFKARLFKISPDLEISERIMFDKPAIGKFVKVTEWYILFYITSIF
jgi:hypothetical protein